MLLFTKNYTLMKYMTEHEQGYFHLVLIIRNQCFGGYQEFFFFLLKSNGNARGRDTWIHFLSC